MLVQRDSNVVYYLSKSIKTILLVLIISIIPNISWANQDTQWLALNIYHEARGEPFLGKLMVALVTLNRVDCEYYPNTVSGVVSQPDQFTWYWTIKEWRPKDIKSWNDCYHIARMVMYLWKNMELSEYVRQMNLDGVKWYHSKDVRPYWAKEKERVIVIGNHYAYR